MVFDGFSMMKVFSEFRFSLSKKIWYSKHIIKLPITYIDINPVLMSFEKRLMKIADKIIIGISSG
jgi:hypothetical protein